MGLYCLERAVFFSDGCFFFWNTFKRILRDTVGIASQCNKRLLDSIGLVMVEQFVSVK